MTTDKKSLPQLFFPIFFEILCSMLTGVVDTLMLSSEGDQAVGAVGTANTYIGIFVIMFSIISSGMIAVMTQYIGAKRPGVAQRAMHLGLLFNLVTGIMISAALYCFAGSILKGIGIADQLLPFCAALGDYGRGPCYWNFTRDPFALGMAYFPAAHPPSIRGRSSGKPGYSAQNHSGRSPCCNGDITV